MPALFTSLYTELITSNWTDKFNFIRGWWRFKASQNRFKKSAIQAWRFIGDQSHYTTYPYLLQRNSGMLCTQRTYMYVINKLLWWGLIKMFSGMKWVVDCYFGICSMDFLSWFSDFVNWILNYVLLCKLHTCLDTLIDVDGWWVSS